MPWKNGRSRTSEREHKARRLRVLRRDRYRCQLAYPGCVGRATISDHIVNLAAGGADTDANSQAVCEPCHDTKTQREAAAARRAQVAQLRHPSEGHPGLM
jgi:5-methylcytosine-specific restriction protein A